MSRQEKNDLKALLEKARRHPSLIDIIARIIARKFYKEVPDAM
jgi:hypothetical protein